MSDNSPSLIRQIDLPPVWLAGFVAIAWAQSRWLPSPPGGTGTLWAGNGLVVIGLALMVVALAQMVTSRTTFVPRQRPSRLLTSGAFGISRNPIYLGDTLVLIGLILRWDAFLTLLLVPVFVLMIQKRFILGEEARNRAEFGAAFDDYAARVRRWL
ncbi:methyltransferase family protein [Actibacterium sp. XHP0104]|uniref:methyltransferase family protein n=1 Tax=Actibacterium sp. XHP0104 TaxID=2984335 RepID=UPI0021E7DCB4|nr:isoprenylcysteine carboxylmethyltransferase family protein [Actibacterium sp. XHP0104]MCV2881364.1 isoprenylcysteine carboxylmethyltransferase family protein [Actibacterium sp. XHP0104]